MTGSIHQFKLLKRLSGEDEVVVCSGEPTMSEYDLERSIEEFETRCYNGMQEAMKTVEGLGIEYDEDVICDVCRLVSEFLSHCRLYIKFVNW